MRMTLALLTLSLLTIDAQSQSQAPTRPHITGIDHVAFYTTQPDGVKNLYTVTLGLAAAAPVEPGEQVRYLVGRQWVGYSSAPDANATDRMDHVAFTTDNISALRKYLIANDVKAPPIEGHPDHSLSFFVSDPEGHRIEFVERDQSEKPVPPPDSAVSRRMIHTGFLVHNRDAEDHFYRQLLGFRPYWYGGMHDGEIDWVSLQVPDGTDWLEYMLNQPEHPDLHRMGVLNHISLGVADMKKAQAILESHGWKPNDHEHSQMGRDGKWQLNVFDPDFSRIELMEFKPAEKPCCSDFTAEHPTE